MIRKFVEYVNKCDELGRYSEKELNFSATDFRYISDLIRCIEKHTKIGIYGTGLHSERLIKVFLKYGLAKKISCFIEEQKEGDQFFGFSVKNSILSACEEYSLEAIVISSKQYEREIYHRIVSQVPKNVLLYRIYNVEKRADERVYFAEDKELEIYMKCDFLQTYRAHLNRYGFALAYVKNKTVLDIACGSGYGSQLLAQRGKKIYGVDIANEAIDFALRHHLEENIYFIQQSIENLRLPEKVDVVISFETIEHLNSSDTYFDKILEFLEEEGMLIISTPLSQKDGISDCNEFHVNEYTLQRFKQELEKYFTEIDYYSQEYKNNGGICLDDGNFSFVSKDHSFAIAVCHHPIKQT